ncbi:PREDICTED: CD209 antigen-like protein E [Branchiostoma belcheri]|uniref:CD209 antigen-like protein E n=1 Tax=Branchiostoma belcheri TaxID=7741 RepID=A0A6P5AM19_BRABE|nr:PREDICTED: CD209 antigen-like protein E [Branchiostoma belcheri]
MSTAASCPKDYTEFRGICYKKSKTHKDFSEAEATCREDGGTLAMAKDAATNAFLVSTLDKVGASGGVVVGRHTTNCCWIGLHDRRHEGSFEWVDGTPLGNFSLWGVAQPGANT